MNPEDWVRVRIKETGAHITIHRDAFDSSLFVELKQDPLDRNGNPRDPKYPTKPSESSADDGGEAAPTANTTPEANKEADR